MLLFDEYIPIEGIESLRELYESHQYVHPLSLRNELKALNELLRLCKAKLTDYPRSLEEDEEILKANLPLQPNQYNGLTLVIEEKRTLHRLIETTTKLINFLKLGPEEIWNVIRTGIIYSEEDLFISEQEDYLIKEVLAMLAQTYFNEIRTEL